MSRPTIMRPRLPTSARAKYAALNLGSNSSARSIKGAVALPDRPQILAALIGRLHPRVVQ